MAHAEHPTHEITHLPTGTTARVSLAERFRGPIARGQLPINDQQHIAMRFKHTDPLPGGQDLSREYVNYSDLDIRPVRPERNFDEAPMRMGPGGEPLDCDECPSCEQGFHERCKVNCPQAFSF